MIEKSISKHMRTAYSKAYPFPHIVIDNFLPETIISEIHKELTTNDVWYTEGNKWIHDYQVNKFFLPSGKEGEVEEIHSTVPKTGLIIDYLNSNEFIGFLEELTGIPNLRSDSEYMHGGGIHKINTGGQLAVHLDYNVHPITKKYRKLNLLLYLNPNWKPEWGGNLELWTKNDSHPATSIEPFFNRCVIFTISPTSFHGHPEPMTCPEDVSRYSIALYYFSEEQPKIEHPVVFMKGDLKGMDLEEFSQDLIFGTSEFGTRN
jgi:Rps23 Pro-64 3,4-dihydroxylase Tpa1-like proline 4-hydroxylase